MTREIELKLAARPSDLARLGHSQALTRYGAGPAQTKRLNTIYYDTPDLGLAKAGFSLRVRRHGRRYVQTVKSRNSAGMLAVERDEWESPLPSSWPDLRLIADPHVRAQMTEIAGDDPVEPKIETQIRRVTRRLTTETGDEIELALDAGEIRTLANGAAKVPVSEVELELVRGSPASLYDIARALSQEAPLKIAVETKAERGLRALEGRAVCPAKAGAVAVPEGASAEDAFRATLRHCLRHLALNVPAVADAHDPEGIHQMRVGLRRFRVALAAFGPAFCNADIEALRTRAKQLADALGEVRDLDVFVEELLLPAAQAASDEPGIAVLRDLAEHKRAVAWQGAIALVESEALAGFLIDLAGATEECAWRARPGEGGLDPERLAELAGPGTAIAERALEKRLAKAKKLGRRIEALEPEDRHRLRIALKKLRYTAEFFAPLYPKSESASFLKRLSELQDIFGALNDVAVARATLASLANADEDEEASCPRFAAGLVYGWHMERATKTWSKALKRWKSFAKTPPFWRETR